MNCQNVFREVSERVRPIPCSKEAVGQFVVACIHEHISKGWLCRDCAERGSGCHRCRCGPLPHRCTMTAHEYAPGTES